MRSDENGDPCPSTLGEYRDLVARICGVQSPATLFFDAKIAKQGRDERVLADDVQVRALIFTLHAGGGAAPYADPRPQQEQ